MRSASPWRRSSATGRRRGPGSSRRCPERATSPDRWRRVTGVFHAALARDAPSRGPLLDEMCGDDASLRAEVDAMLAAHGAAEGFGDAPAFVPPEDAPRLVPGQALGPYRIEALIEAGGMGEVYRARDTRLDRTVAVKVVGTHAASDPSLRRRLDREARALATLSHPHICRVFDVGQHDGVDFLVMEYLDGETLEKRLARGALPLDVALRHAIEIAGALDAAHGVGVVHRDLKPGNVMLTKDGARILDFGLAKLRATGLLADVAGEAPASKPLTRRGTILGTLRYMAPEQLNGEDADARSDIFALGALIHEMVTGAKAFDGKTPASVIAAVLEREPTAVSRLRPMSPPALDHLVRTCLAKDRERRWQSAGDVGRQLAWFLEAPGAGDGAAPAPPGRRRTTHLALAAGAIGALAGLIAWTRPAAPPSRPRAIQRFEHVLAEGQELRNADRPVLAFAPDGSHLVYNTTEGLFLRSLPDVEARLVAGTEGDVSSPFYSPDGRWIGFHAGGELKKVSTSGGAPIALAPLEKPFGAHWAADGWIVIGQGAGVVRVRDSGGAPEWLLRTAADEQAYGPQVLPGGEWLLLTLAPKASPNRWNNARIVAVSLRSGERRQLWTGGSDARYVPTGHLVFAARDRLFALRFDAENPRVSGEPVTVLDGVHRAGYPGVHTGYASYAFSQDGTLVFLGSVDPAPERGLALFDRKGTVERLDVPPAPYVHVQVSPDGTRVAAQTLGKEGEGEIWIHDLAAAGQTRQLTIGGNSFHPHWTPDGRRVSFASDRGGVEAIYWQPVDGGAAERLVESEIDLGERDMVPPLRPEAWSRVGPTLAYRIRSATGSALWTLVPGSGRPPKLLAHVPGSDQYEASFSPDGKWFAYCSSETGRDEIYIEPFPPTGEKHRLSRSGGTFPMWSPDGREIFYRRSFDTFATRGTGMPLFRVGITTAGGVRFGAEQEQQMRDFLVFRGFRNYSMTPDGKKFLFVVLAGKHDGRPRITIVQNWFEELKARVPGS